MRLIEMLSSTPKPLYNQPTKHKPRGTMNWDAAHAAVRQRTETWYKSKLFGKVVSTPDLALMRGVYRSCDGPLATLRRLEKQGLVRCLGYGKKTSKYGKPPLLWTWVS